MVSLLEGSDDVWLGATQITCIPLLSKARLHCCFSRKMEGDSLINYTVQLPLPEGLVVGRTLVLLASEEVCIVVTNLLDESRMVSTGKLLDMCKVVEKTMGLGSLPNGPLQMEM